MQKYCIIGARFFIFVVIKVQRPTKNICVLGTCHEADVSALPIVNVFAAACRGRLSDNMKVVPQDDENGYMKHYIYFFLCMLCMACTVNDEPHEDASRFEAAAEVPAYHGSFTGFWMIDNRRVGEGSLEIGAWHVYNSLPLDADMQAAIAGKLGTDRLSDMQPELYAVPYREAGYTAGSLYFDMLPGNYTRKVAVGGQQHTVTMVMERAHSAAVYDKQTMAFVALFKLNAILVDEEVVKVYQPELTIQFNSTKKTRTSGVGKEPAGRNS